MSKQTINIGASPNDGTGTPLRTSFDYTNQNFTEIYTALGGGVALPGATTQVIFNDGGTNLAGDAGLVYNKTTDALTIAGPVNAASASITGAATVGTTLGVTGSVSAGNLNVTNSPIPANGVYLSATNTLCLATASTLRATLTATGLGLATAPASALSFPIGTVISGTEVANRFFQDMVPSKLIHDKYKPEIIMNVIRRQLALKQQRGNSGSGSNVDPRAFLILDDCLFDNTWIQQESTRYV